MGNRLPGGSAVVDADRLAVGPMCLDYGFFGELQRFKNRAAFLGCRFEERANVTVRNDEDVTRRNGEAIA